jgi:uncharacterized protein (DUF1778 family)
VEPTQTGVSTCGNPAIPQPQAAEATCSVRLSERDAAEVMATAEKPPVPNEVAMQAARRFIQRHG